MLRAADALGCDSSGCILIYTVCIPAYKVVPDLRQGTSQHFACGQHQRPPSWLLLQSPGDLCSEVDLDIFITLVPFFIEGQTT